MAGLITITSSDVGKTLQPGIYRIAAPFGKPFTIALSSEWKFEELSRTAASFTDARQHSRGDLGIDVAFGRSVYADPCHRSRPLPAPRPSNVDGMVEALTNGVGYEVIPYDGWFDTDPHIGDRAASGFVLDAQVFPEGAHCFAYDKVWVVDVDGTPTVIRGTSYHRIAAGGLILSDAIESISFD